MNALLIALAITTALFLGWYIRLIVERAQRLEKQVEESAKKIEELSAIASRRKLPYPAQAGIEDSIAIVLAMLDEDEIEMAKRITLKNQLLDRLKIVRSDPQHYDIHQPINLPRKKGK